MKLYDDKIPSIINEVKKVIIGKDDIIEKVLISILAKGHILIEDIPGVGKTTLALAFSKATELKQNRMQFTPDVLPTDVVGFSVLKPDGTGLQYRPGAVFCNLFLADEINRTSSKTQSALLEVMEEGRVTVDGITRNLPEPFIVIATQNPIGSVGTQMLPESQMDRFMVRLTMGYPDINSEIDILKGRQHNSPLAQVEQIITCEELMKMQKRAAKVFIHDEVYEYIADLVAGTREHPLIQLGVSPRGTIALANLAKAKAYITNRNFVQPDDIRDVFIDVTAHRLILSPKARVNHVSVQDVLKDILNQSRPPALIK